MNVSTQISPATPKAPTPTFSEVLLRQNTPAEKIYCRSQLSQCPQKPGQRSPSVTVRHTLCVCQCASSLPACRFICASEFRILIPREQPYLYLKCQHCPTLPQDMQRQGVISVTCRCAYPFAFGVLYECWIAHYCIYSLSHTPTHLQQPYM